MKNKNTIWIVVSVCLIIYLIPNIIYYCKLNKNGWSSNPDQWAQYGDFIGGSLNPVLTVLNIIALVYLTYIVSHVDDNRAMNHFRFEIYKEINDYLDPITLASIVENDEKKQTSIELKITKIKVRVNSFYDNNYFLFIDNKLDYKSVIDKLHNSLDGLKIEIEKVDVMYEDPSAMGQDPWYYNNEVIKAFESFSKERNNLKFFIQKVMLNFPTS